MTASSIFWVKKSFIIILSIKCNHKKYALTLFIFLEVTCGTNRNNRDVVSGLSDHIAGGEDSSIIDVSFLEDHTHFTCVLIDKVLYLDIQNSLVK